VTEVAVFLDKVGQRCCGPLRQVGDTFSSSIHNYRGVIYEERHADGVSIRCFPMTGVIKGIAWRPVLDQNHRVADPKDWFGPAIPISLSDQLPDDVEWILEFTVETSDPIPVPRTDFL
jgi:hypothetical protein